MPGDNSRVARAGDYVLGLMSDAERERAERDLEVDTAFRDTVMQMAERMHVFDRSASETDRPDDRWTLIAGRIAELPQMQFSAAGISETAPHTNRSEPRQSHRPGLYRPARHALLIALGLIVAFVLGYLAGKL